jgi:hypothetical protein
MINLKKIIENILIDSLSLIQESNVNDSGWTEAEQETRDELVKKFTDILNKNFPGTEVVTEAQVGIRLALFANPKLLEISKSNKVAYTMMKTFLSEGKLMYGALLKFGVDKQELDALIFLERKGTTFLSNGEKQYD